MGSILFIAFIIESILGRISIDPFFGMPKELEGDYNTTTFD